MDNFIMLLPLKPLITSPIAVYVVIPLLFRLRSEVGNSLNGFLPQDLHHFPLLYFHIHFWCRSESISAFAFLYDLFGDFDISARDWDPLFTVPPFRIFSFRIWNRIAVVFVCKFVQQADWDAQLDRPTLDEV